MWPWQEDNMCEQKKKKKKQAGGRWVHGKFMSLLFWKEVGKENKVFMNNVAYWNRLSCSDVLRMDAASYWLQREWECSWQSSIRVFMKKEEGPGPLPSLALLLLLQPAFPAELLAASRHWGRNSSGADKWHMILASNYMKGPEPRGMVY